MTNAIPHTKKDEVAELTRLCDTYPIVGVVNMANLPALQLQRMKQKLHGTVVLRMSKKTLMRRALAASKKKELTKLEQHIKGMPAFIFTENNPFTLYKTLKRSKSKAPIKAGQIAPNDIVVPAGVTSFAPGPVIGELGSFKIKTGIENGKVAIKADAVVAKEGEAVSDKLAAILTRLGIEPMEIGLDLLAVYEEGDVLTKDLLDVDEEAVLAQFGAAAAEAFNLAIASAYPNAETITPLLSMAAAQARSLAREAHIPTKETIQEMLALAHGHGAALKTKTG